MKADMAHLNHRFKEQLITVVFVKTGKNLIAKSFTAFNWLPYCFQSKAQKCVLQNKPYERGFSMRTKLRTSDCVPSKNCVQYLIRLVKTHNPPVLKRCRIKKRAGARKNKNYETFVVNYTFRVVPQTAQLGWGYSPMGEKP